MAKCAPIAPLPLPAPPPIAPLPSPAPPATMDSMKKMAKAKAMDMGMKAIQDPKVQKAVVDQVKKDPKLAMDIGKKMVSEAMKTKK